MTIKELAEKYNLSKEDFWELPQKKGLWIISHNACEKIASIEKIELTDIRVLNSEKDFCRFLVTMKKNDMEIMTIGEADKSNCHNLYIGSMAEKRGVDRAILKLINAYEYDVYSEIESDDFKKEVYNPLINRQNTFQELFTLFDFICTKLEKHLDTTDQSGVDSAYRKHVEKKLTEKDLQTIIPYLQKKYQKELYGIESKIDSAIDNVDKVLQEFGGIV
jgi:hypothetical protein